MFVTNAVGVTIVRSATVLTRYHHEDGFISTIHSQVSEESTVAVGADEIPYSALSFLLAILPSTENGVVI